MASNSKTYTRICVDCGKVMQQVYQTKMRCPECAAQRKRLLHAQWQARHKEEIRSLTPGLPVLPAVCSRPRPRISLSGLTSGPPTPPV